MPVYKESPFQLQRAVESILNQTFQDIEFIIVLDNPDNIEAKYIILNYAEQYPFIKPIFNEVNYGIGYTRNAGIKAAQGEYIATMDADDESVNDRIEKQLIFLLNNDYNCLGTGLVYYDGISYSNSFYKIFSNDINNAIRKHSPVWGATMMCRKEIFLKYGFYDPSKKRLEDYEIMIRWYLQGVSFYNLEECLYKYYRDSIPGNNRIQNDIRMSVKLKLKYAKRLHFKFNDYLFLIYEYLLSMFPDKLFIVLTFWFNNIIKSNGKPVT